MIRSSSHALKFANSGKRKQLDLFTLEYQRLLQAIIDDVWAHGIPEFDFCVSRNRLFVPSFLPNDYLKSFDSWLSARMKQCVGKQACAMLSAAVKKRNKQLFMLGKLQRNGGKYDRLQSKIDRQPLVKPNASKAKPEIDTRFINFKTNSKEFGLFVEIRTIGNGMKLRIPIKLTSQSEKWIKRGERKSAIRLGTDKIWLIYEVADKPKKEGITVGCDQGYKTVVTLSDGQITGPCHHGHTLETIQAKLSRRKKGSEGFKRAQDHRENYINWSLNQLNWSLIGKVRFEKVFQLRTGKKSSRLLSHWIYTAIKDKVFSLSESEGFEFEEVENAFRSQRCSHCGWVRKANRKGKTFTCNLCGFTTDADVNAASNLELDLFEIPFLVRFEKLNIKGFYWTTDGIFSQDHEPIVRDTQKA
jgi:transposase